MARPIARSAAAAPPWPAAIAFASRASGGSRRAGASTRARAARATSTAGRGAPSPASAARALLEACVVAAAVVVPLYFNPRTERVFEPDKLAWVATLAAVALAGLAVSAADRPSATLRALRRPLPLAMAALALAVVVGTLLSVSPTISVWGAYRRGHGAIAWLAWLALAAAAAAATRWAGPRERLRAALIAPAVPAALYALLQRLRIDVIPWQQYGDAAAVRAFGPLGNAIFLGAYLAVVAPLAAEAAHRAWRRGDRLRAAAHGAILVLCAGGVLASQSRGPALGLVAGLGALALLGAARAGRGRLVAAAALAAVVLPLGLVGLGRMGAPGLERFGDLLSPESRTVRQRALVWDGLAGAAAANPVRLLVGTGPETTALILPRHAPEELRELAPEQVFDRAHNVLWEWWVSAGLVGVLAFVAVQVAAFGTAFRVLGWLAGPAQAAALAASAAAGAAGGALLASLVAPALAAGGAALGLAAAMTGWGAWSGHRAATRSAPAAQDEGRHAVALAVPSVLAAHLVEGALGLPTAGAELVAWLAIGLLLGAARSGDEPGQPPADSAVADGLLIGLGLSAVALAPILLPFGVTALFDGPEAALLLLPAVLWIALAMTLPPAGEPLRRDGVALVVLAAFAVAFRLLQGRVGGPTLAFAAVLAAVVGGMAARRALRGHRAPSAPSEAHAGGWASFCGALLVAAAIAAWFGLRPVLADAWLRRGLEQATLDDHAAMSAAFDRAVATWPEQPVFALYVAAARRDAMLADGASEEARAVAFAEGASALEGAWERAAAPEYARQLGALHRERGDLAATPEDRSARWDSSEAWLERALDVDPNEPTALVERGALLERRGDAAAAAAAYRAALRAGPSDPPLLVALARAELGGQDPTGVDRAAEALGEGWAAAQARGDDAIAFAALATDPGPSAAGPLGDPVSSRARLRAQVLALAVAGREDAAREALASLRVGPGQGAVEEALAAWLAAAQGSR